MIFTMNRKIVNAIMLIIGFVIAFNLFFMSNYHHRRASDCDRLLKGFRLNLPAIADSEAYDNYDRGASRWDCHEYYIRFEQDYSERTIKRFERRCKYNKHWTKVYYNDLIVYVYFSEPEWKSDRYFYKCYFEEGKCKIEYYIDEDEAIFNILIYGALLFLWIIVFAVITSYPFKSS